MIVPEEVIMIKIMIIRRVKVMIDHDLGELYGVPTKRINEQVKRNIKRFPDDFMFQLTEKEKLEVVANCDHLKMLAFSPNLPYVFTEHGALMLSSVLNNARAIMVNIHIVRVFAKMRQLLETHTEILLKLDQIRMKDLEQDRQILLIFEYIRQLEQARQQQQDQSERRRIGFRTSDET